MVMNNLQGMCLLGENSKTFSLSPSISHVLVEVSLTVREELSYIWPSSLLQQLVCPSVGDLQILAFSNC